MGPSIGIFSLLVFLGAGLVATAWWLTVRLAPEKKRGRIIRWLIAWLSKGVLVPMALWAILNLGVSIYLQPFMPSLQAARNQGAPWTAGFLFIMAGGCFLVCTYWSAVTLGWVLASSLETADARARRDFKQLCLTWLLGLGIPAGLILLCGGLKTAGLAGTLLLVPVAGYARDFLQPKKLPPMYARAIARMKRGKYTEAESEILKELDNWEDDFDGWMMLAELYANQFNSLHDAEETVLDICAQPQTTVSQVSVALHRLADWHLKLAKDPDAARRCLLMICDRLQGTHLAHMAQLRIDQLPASAAELREQQHARPIALPALGDQLDEPSIANPSGRAKAVEEANALVEQLNQNPNNVLARERLARIMAERLDKPEQAIEQLDLLMEMPERSDSERAEWLSLVAAWQIKFRKDHQAGREALDRLTREYPASVQALAARRRLTLLARESKIRPPES